MSASDNLEAIWAAPFGDVLDALDALMAQHGRVFLIGAGCSKCAGWVHYSMQKPKEMGQSSMHPSRGVFKRKIVLYQIVYQKYLISKI